MEEAEKENLQKRRKGYDTNRNLAAAVAVLLVYMTFKDFKTEPGSVLFYVIMGALFCGAVAVTVYDTILIRRLDKELKNSSDEQ